MKSGKERFHREFNGLKRWLRKNCTAGFEVKAFIRGFCIRIFKVRYGFKNFELIRLNPCVVT